MDIAKTMPADSKTMEFRLSPDTKQSFEKDTFEIKFDSGAKAQIHYNSQLTGSKTPFEITFFDNNDKLLKFVKYGYRIEDSTGKKVYESKDTEPNAPGILLTEGIDKQEHAFEKPGKYKITLAIFNHGLDNLQTLSGIASGFFDLTGGSSKPIQTIPSWIKNNAGWWKDGSIGDSDFVQGIQLLITNSIMKIPSTVPGVGSGSNEIPSWIKNNAGWWKDGSIGDSDLYREYNG